MAIFNGFESKIELSTDHPLCDILNKSAVGKKPVPLMLGDVLVGDVTVTSTTIEIGCYRKGKCTFKLVINEPD